MKKIIPFLMVLGVLAAGIVYYVYETQKTPIIEEVTVTTTEKPVQSVKVEHPGWKDTIIMDEGNRAHRQANNDRATVTNLTDNSFTLVWDAWGIEVFQKDPQTGIYKLKESRKK